MDAEKRLSWSERCRWAKRRREGVQSGVSSVTRDHVTNIITVASGDVAASRIERPANSNAAASVACEAIRSRHVGIWHEGQPAFAILGGEARPGHLEVIAGLNEAPAESSTPKRRALTPERRQTSDGTMQDQVRCGASSCFTPLSGLRLMHHRDIIRVAYHTI